MAVVNDLGHRLEALRSAMKTADIQAFVVPRADRYQNEYVAPSDERLLFISGFSGSAGVAVVTQREAALFTDGRYLLQAETETPSTVWKICDVKEGSPMRWLLTRLGKGDKVGFDPNLHTERDIEAKSRELHQSGVELVQVQENPIDVIWTNRPPLPSGMVEIYPPDLSGEPTSAKLARVKAALSAEGCDGVLVTALDCLAWALNIRGADLRNHSFRFWSRSHTEAKRSDVFRRPGENRRANRRGALRDRRPADCRSRSLARCTFGIQGHAVAYRRGDGKR